MMPIAGLLILLGTPVAAASPAQTKYVAVELYKRRTCGLDDSGGLHCWGDTLLPTPRAEGFRFNSLTESSRPCAIEVKGALWCEIDGERWKKVLDRGFTSAASMQTFHGKEDHWCGVTRAGKALCFLLKADGTTGPIWDRAGKARFLSAQHGCLLAKKGEVWCLKGGRDWLKPGIQLSEEDEISDLTFKKWQLPAAVVEVHEAGSELCGRTKDGPLVCVERDGVGKMRVDKTATYRDLNAWRAKRGCAIKSSGELWCWGRNGKGQLGLGDTSYRRAPHRVGARTDWKQVACGENHTCAVTTSGEAYCWGSNETRYRQKGSMLGHGREGAAWSRSTPGRVGTLMEEGTVPTAPVDETPWPMGLADAHKRTQKHIQACWPAIRACESDRRANVRLDVFPGATPDGPPEFRFRSPEDKPGVQACLRKALATCGLPSQLRGHLFFWARKGKPLERITDGDTEFTERGQVAHYSEHLTRPPPAEGGPFDKGPAARPQDGPEPAAFPEPPPCDRKNRRHAAPFDFGYAFPLPVDVVERKCAQPTKRGWVTRFDFFLGSPQEGQGYLGSGSVWGNLPHGRWQMRDEQGRLLVDEEYAFGVPVGHHRRWDRTGRRTKDCRYTRGRPVGLCREWIGFGNYYEPASEAVGHLAAERRYDRRGRPTGTWRAWGWRRGGLKEEITWARKPQDTRGRIRYGGYGGPHTVVIGTKKGTASYKLSSGRLQEIILRDRYHKVTRTLRPCKAVTKEAEGVASRTIRQWHERAPSSRKPPASEPSAARTRTEQLYKTKTRVTKDGRKVVELIGRQGTHVANDRVEVQSQAGSMIDGEQAAKKGEGKAAASPAPPNGEGWTPLSKFGLYTWIRHPPGACTDPFQSEGLPDPKTVLERDPAQTYLLKKAGIDTSDWRRMREGMVKQGDRVTWSAEVQVSQWSGCSKRRDHPVSTYDTPDRINKGLVWVDEATGKEVGRGLTYAAPWDGAPPKVYVYLERGEAGRLQQCGDQAWGGGRGHNDVRAFPSASSPYRVEPFERPPAP